MEKMPFDLNDFRPGIRLGAVRAIAVVILLGALFLTSFFTVSQEEVGVVLRFGEYNRLAQPGLNFKMPLGIETVQKVPVLEQLKAEFGFQTEEIGQRTRYSQRNFDDVALMLTGDLNIADVEWSVQYRINDPYKYLFRVRNAEETFEDINEAVMREIVGDRPLNAVLNNRTEIGVSAKTEIQQRCDQYELGFEVEQVLLQAVTVPDMVKPAFNEVNEAVQEREKLINEAQAEYNRIVPRARGEAARMVEEAHGYALARVNNAKGDAARFNALYDEYRKAREVTRQRLYLETMNSVLQRVGNKLITDEDAAGVLPLLNLNEGGLKK